MGNHLVLRLADSGQFQIEVPFGVDALFGTLTYQQVVTGRG